MDNEKVYAMKFSKVYPLLVAKAERKGRMKEEVDEIICWLTGYDQAGLDRQLEEEVDYRTFFAQAPCMNPDRALIKGVVCGIRVENIEEPLMQEIRYLDKLVDELAKGKAMDKILRKSGGNSKTSGTGKTKAAAGKKAGTSKPAAIAGKPADVDAYIAAAPEAAQEVLQNTRKVLQDALPNATEKISWSMPTYWDGHNIIHFAAMKNHLGIYPGAEAVEHFSGRLDEPGYKHSKGAIQFPYKKEIPYDLIREIAIWCNTTGNHA